MFCVGIASQYIENSHQITCCVPLTLGPQADQGRTATLQGGGRDAEGASAPQHRPFL